MSIIFFNLVQWNITLVFVEDNIMWMNTRCSKSPFSSGITAEQMKLVSATSPIHIVTAITSRYSISQNNNEFTNVGELDIKLSSFNTV